MKMLRSLYLNNLFFWALAGIAAIFVLSFAAGFLFFVAQILILAMVLIVAADIYLLFRKGFRVDASRDVAPVISLGDENKVWLHVANQGSNRLHLEIIDELPHQFQERDFRMNLRLEPGSEKTLNYNLRPLRRGEFLFGDINVFSSTAIGLLKRRDILPATMNVAVFPSTVMLRRFELFSVQKYTTRIGVRKIRRIGHSYEFEHIRSYVPGDDPRSINWKASSRRSDLMVNHFMDEKAQQVYCVLDKSRAMQMPFEGLTLLDHAINTSLVISRVVLQKHDKAGLISFSNRIGNIIKAGSGKMQLNKIYNALYNEKENPLEANYELMYNAVRKLMGGRSLLFLFTNFESVYAMERVLPILRQINRRHLLVVVFFKNIEVARLAGRECLSTDDIYLATIARNFLSEKQMIINELQKHKIQTVFTDPLELPVNTINKYFELKSRGLI